MSLDAIPKIVKATAMHLKPLRNRVDEINSTLEEVGTQAASEFLEARELLAAGVKPVAEVFALPHTCLHFALASGGQVGGHHAQQHAIATLEERWQNRHKGVRAAPSTRTRCKPVSVCVFPGGCVCHDWAKKLYGSILACLKRIDTDVLQQGRAVFRLDKCANEAPPDLSEPRVVLDTQWFHVSYVCFKPWRAVIVKLNEVDQWAEELHSEDTQVSGFVRPVLVEGQPCVMPLQRLVSEMEREWMYEASVYATSSAITPMPILKGHARVFLTRGRQQLWLGLAREKIARPKGRRTGPTAQDSEQRDGDIDDEDQDSDMMMEDEAVGLERELESLMEAALPEDSEPIGRQASGGPDSSSTSSTPPQPDSQRDDVTQPAAASVTTRTVHPSTIADWYGFRLTWIDRQSGSWQATCPFHRKARTGTHCKKTLSVGSDSPQVALLKIKAWCITAAHHDRHRSHMAEAVVHTGLTELELDEKAEALRRAKGDTRPLRDDELDAS